MKAEVIELFPKSFALKDLECEPEECYQPRSEPELFELGLELMAAIIQASSPEVYERVMGREA